MAERSPEELQREITCAREDLLWTVRRMRAVVHTNLSILEQIKRHPIAAGAAAALLGALLGVRVARTGYLMRRPRMGRRMANALRRLFQD